IKTGRPPCPPPTSRRRTRRGRSPSPGGRAWWSPYRELRPPRPTPRPSPTRLRRRAFATALAFVLATLAVGSRSAPASAASCPGHTAELGIRLVDVTRRQGTAQVTITVPERVTDGERYAVVWAERQPPVSAKPGVQLAVRVGIRLYLSVGKGREPAFDFTIKSLRAGRDHSGRPFVIATVVDVGGRAVDLTGQLRLSHGPHGTLAGPYPADQGVT